MKELTLKAPIGLTIHITGSMGSGKTTLQGDMLLNEQKEGKCAYIFTRREGNIHSGGWSVLPKEVLDPESNTRIIFAESIEDIDKLFMEWKKEPLKALAFDTSTGLELLIKAKITGDDMTELVSTGHKYQHKKFKNMLSHYLENLRVVSKYSMLVSPAIPTTYNAEKGTSEGIEQPKRFGPDGETNDSKTRLLYLCDYAFHIEQDEGRDGGIDQRILHMAPSLRLLTKHRIPLGKELKDMVLSNQVGENWPKLKQAINEAHS